MKENSCFVIELNWGIGGYKMLLALKILIMLALIIGIIVCAIGMRRKNLLYKGGFFFFLLTFMAEIYSLIIRSLADSIVEKLMNKGANNIGFWIMNLNIPYLLLTAAALVIFIIFLLKGLDTNHDKYITDM